VRGAYVDAHLVGAPWVEIAVELGRDLWRRRAAPQVPQGGLAPAQLRRIDERIAQPAARPAIKGSPGSAGSRRRRLARPHFAARSVSAPTNIAARFCT